MQQNILFFPDIQIFYLRTQSAHNNGSILVPYQFMPAVLGRYFWSWSNSDLRLVGKYFDLYWLAGLLPVFLILVQPWPKIGSQCTDLCWPAGLLPVLLILVQPWPKIAGQRIDLCWPACPLPAFLILVQPWPKFGGQCITSNECW